MGKIFYILGKSAVGKDHIFERVLAHPELSLERIIMYTTRPMRAKEQEGREYHFVGKERLEEFREAGKIIESRIYHTVHGPWAYFTADDGAIRLSERNYLGIGTLESYRGVRDYYGADRVLPVYIQVEDTERLQRALDREKKQASPNCAEVCRRYLADEADFTEENLRDCGIHRRFENRELAACVEEIAVYISSCL